MLASVCLSGLSADASPVARPSLPSVRRQKRKSDSDDSDSPPEKKRSIVVAENAESAVVSNESLSDEDRSSVDTQSEEEKKPKCKVSLLRVFQYLTLLCAYVQDQPGSGPSLHHD